MLETLRLRAVEKDFWDKFQALNALHDEDFADFPFWPKNVHYETLSKDEIATVEHAIDQLTWEEPLRRLATRASTSSVWARRRTRSLRAPCMA